MPELNQREIFQVSSLVSSLRAGLESLFPAVWLEGEVSSMTAARSGHWYFNLKDDKAQIRCVFFRYQRGGTAQPVVGQNVLVRGRPGIYPERGELQLILEHLEDSGEGAMRRAYELLLSRLRVEGLFEPGRKRALPAELRTIGLITSPAGAVVHDMLSTLQRRNPLLRVIVYPSAVQGAAAAGQLLQALQVAERRDEVDLLILARGGGSLEDLQAFNDESLARAVAACALPVISAVGHETDFTIADFVADLRAATPTAAAELVSGNLLEYLDSISRLRGALARAFRAQLAAQRGQYAQRVTRLRAHDPRRQLETRAQRLDDLNRRLQRAARTRLSSFRTNLHQQRQQISKLSPEIRIHRARIDGSALERRLMAAVRRSLSARQKEVAHCVERHRQLSPERVLARGFAIAWQSDHALRGAGDVNRKLPIRLQLADGELKVGVRDAKDAKQ